MASFELVASKLAALKPRFGSIGGGVKTGSGGKNDGGRPVSAAGRGGGGGRGRGTWSSGSSSSGYADRNAGRGTTVGFFMPCNPMEIDVSLCSKIMF